jgi:ankyrin repeat protein
VVSLNKVIIALALLNGALALTLQLRQRNAQLARFFDQLIKGDAAYVRRELARGKRADLSTADGTTALMLAAGLQKLSLAEDLLAVGADVDVRNHNGESALMMLAFSATANSTWKLVRPRHIDQLDLHGHSALSGAAITGRCHAVDALIGKGADPLVKGGVGLDAFDSNLWYASGSCLPAMIRAKGLPPHWSLFDPALQGQLRKEDFLDAVSSRGTSWEATDEAFGETLLIGAARRGDAPLVRALLARGANRHAMDRFGEDARRIAARLGHTAITRMLAHE